MCSSCAGQCTKCIQCSTPYHDNDWEPVVISGLPDTFHLQRLEVAAAAPLALRAGVPAAGCNRLACGSDPGASTSSGIRDVVTIT